MHAGPGSRAYAEAHGQFRLNIGKHTLSVKGSVIEGRGNSDLAYALYGRKLIQVTVLPSVSQQQLAAFVQILGMDRAKLEESGGARHLLKASGVADIQVKELAMDANEEAETLGLDAFFGLLGQGRLKPQEREKILEILRAGPEQAGRLLQNTYALSGNVGGGGGGDAQVQQVFQAIKGLERVIMDESYADHQPLYASLGEAVLLPEGPEGALGPRLGRALLAGARDDQGTQVLLDHLSSEQLANIILNSLGEGDVVGQVADALNAFTPDPEKAGRILSYLDLALPQAGERGVPISVAVMMKLEFPAFAAPDEALDFSEFIEDRIAVPEEERERVLREIRSVDQAGAIHDALRTCVDILATRLDKDELSEVAESVVGDLDWLIEHREFALLREILTHVKTLASPPEGERAEVIRGLLERVVDGPLLQKLLEAFWQGRATLVELEIQKVAEVLGGILIGPLARALGTELPPRKVLSRLLRFGHGLSASRFRGPVPSAGGLQALELYLVVLEPAWLPTGVYHYDRAAHHLAQVVPGATRAEWQERVPAMHLVGGGAFVWVLVGDGARVEKKYGERGFRFLLLEAGHLMQNLCLLSASLGLSTVPLGGALEPEIARSMNLPADDAKNCCERVRRSASVLWSLRWSCTAALVGPTCSRTSAQRRRLAVSRPSRLIMYRLLVLSVRATIQPVSARAFRWRLTVDCGSCTIPQSSDTVSSWPSSSSRIRLRVVSASDAR